MRFKLKCNKPKILIRKTLNVDLPEQINKDDIEEVFTIIERETPRL